MSHFGRFDQQYLISSAHSLREEMYEYHEPTPHLYGHTLSQREQTGPRPGRSVCGEPSHCLEHQDHDLATTYVLRTPSGSVYIPSDVAATDLCPQQLAENTTCRSYQATFSRKEDRYATPFSTMTTNLPTASTTRFCTTDSHYHTVESPARKSLSVLRHCSWRGAAATLLVISLTLVSLLLYLLTVVGSESHPVNDCSTQPEKSLDYHSESDSQQSRSFAEVIQFRAPVIHPTTTGNGASLSARSPGNAFPRLVQLPAASVAVARSRRHVLEHVTSVPIRTSSQPGRSVRDDLSASSSIYSSSSAVSAPTVAPSNISDRIAYVEDEDASGLLETSESENSIQLSATDAFDNIVENSGPDADDLLYIEPANTAGTFVSPTHRESASTLEDKSTEINPIVNYNNFDDTRRKSSYDENALPSNDMVASDTMILKSRYYGSDEKNEENDIQVFSTVPISDARVEKVSEPSLLDGFIDRPNLGRDGVVNFLERPLDDLLIAPESEVLHTQSSTQFPPGSTAYRTVNINDAAVENDTSPLRDVTDIQWGVVDKIHTGKIEGKASFEQTNNSNSVNDAEKLSKENLNIENSVPTLANKISSTAKESSKSLKHSESRVIELSKAVRNITLTVSIDDYAGKTDQLYVISIGLPSVDDQTITANFKKATEVEDSTDKIDQHYPISETETEINHQEVSGSNNAGENNPNNMTDVLKNQVNKDSFHRNSEQNNQEINLENTRNSFKKTYIKSGDFRCNLEKFQSQTLSIVDSRTADTMENDPVTQPWPENSSEQSDQLLHNESAEDLPSDTRQVSPDTVMRSAQQTGAEQTSQTNFVDNQTFTFTTKASEERAVNSTNGVSSNLTATTEMVLISQKLPDTTSNISPINKTNKVLVSAPSRVPEEVYLNQRYFKHVSAHSYWLSEVYISDSSHLQWQLKSQLARRLVMYGRRAAPPTPTHYDFVQVLGTQDRPEKTAVVGRFAKVLQAGHWLFKLYNAASHDIDFSLLIVRLDSTTTAGCAAGCSGHGKCLLDTCQCEEPFAGDDCSDVTSYSTPWCSEDHMCLGDHCQCRGPESGAECPQGNATSAPLCSGRGSYDVISGACLCQSGFKGVSCSEEACSPDCGSHGKCFNQRCQCDAGWHGVSCLLPQCNDRCSLHGECVNGSCRCNPGWNGKHCTLEGCPSNCNGRGECQYSDWQGRWSCQCNSDWSSPDCSILLETECHDQQDNDQDGLVDCEDPDCCHSDRCYEGQLCVTVPDPVDILLRSHAPPATASFFNQISFLLVEGSVQRYPSPQAFGVARVSVVRGRVTTATGTAVPGVRIGTDSDLEGFTLSRLDGWFDLVVNGGGVVSVWFRKPPFWHISRSVFVPWNDFVVLNDVIMVVQPVKPADLNSNTLCSSHDPDKLNLQAFTVARHEFFSGCDRPKDGAEIFAETQVLRHTLTIPGTRFALNYVSSANRGFMSTIHLQLTPSFHIKELEEVHLIVDVQGQRFMKVFEAEPDLKYVYSWDSLNAYRQRVYGLSTARIKVGYKYSDCRDTVWHVMSKTIAASDLQISDVGGWNLNVHSIYNPHHGILQHGSGEKIVLANLPGRLVTVMGSGEQRPFNCPPPYCQGAAEQQQLLAVSALAAAADGTLYLADGNMIRQLSPDGLVHTLALINETMMASRYYLSYSAKSGCLYLSVPEKHVILKTRSLVLESVSVVDNLQVAVGSGVRCSVTDDCGDGLLATAAQLAYPKGISETSQGVLYMVDDTAVRKVDTVGKIITVLGSRQNRNKWRPLPCLHSAVTDTVKLNSPTAVAISPIDDSVFILDDNIVLQIDGLNRVRRVAGRLAHCPLAAPSVQPSWLQQSPLGHPLAVDFPLTEPTALTVDAQGRLLIAESDGKRVNRLQIVDHDGTIRLLAGANSPCNCLDDGCNCYGGDVVTATQAVFGSISAVSALASGHIVVSDQDNHRLRVIYGSLPSLDANGHYTIEEPLKRQLLVFDRVGKHLHTYRLADKTLLLTFEYSTSGGVSQLTSVTHSGSQKLTFARDLTHQVSLIVNGRGNKNSVSVSRRDGMLESFVTADHFQHNYTYDENNGLLTEHVDSSGRRVVVDYSQHGRVQRVTETASRLALSSSVDGGLFTVIATRNDQLLEKLQIFRDTVFRLTSWGESQISCLSDGTVELISPGSHSRRLTQTAPAAVDNSSGGAGAVSLPYLHSQLVSPAAQIVSGRQWLSLPGNSPQQPRGQLVVNGSVALRFFTSHHGETFTDVNNSTLLQIENDAEGRPTVYHTPALFHDIEIKYNDHGWLTEWIFGDRKTIYNYDGIGRIIETETAHSRVQMGYDSNDELQPSWVELASGARYQFGKDEHGKLTSVTLPSGLQHQWSYRSLLSSYSLTYTVSAAAKPYILIFADNMKTVQPLERRLGDGRRVLLRYDMRDRLRKQSWSGGQTSFFYCRESGGLSSVEHEDSGFRSVTRLAHTGALLTRTDVSFTPTTALTAYSLQIQYDNLARVTQVKLLLDSGLSYITMMRFSSVFGHIEQINDFYVTRPNKHTTILKNSRFEHRRITDSYGHVHMLQLSVRGRVSSTLTQSLDAAGRVARTEFNISDWRSVTTSYSYHDQGQLARVVVENNFHGRSQARSEWKHSYDAAGNLHQVFHNAKLNECKFSELFERIELCSGEYRIQYDENGFVTSAGSQNFSYNSFGRLDRTVKITENGSVVLVQYGYDFSGRLSWRISQDPSSVADRVSFSQLIYADPLHPHRLTHVYQRAMQLTTQYVYDDQGLLIQLHQGEQEFHVATGSDGTPLALFNPNGVPVAVFDRDPWGVHMTHDMFSVPLMLDLYGWLWDGEMQLLFDKNRPYSPILRQYLTPDLSVATPGPLQLAALHPYRLRSNNPALTHSYGPLFPASATKVPLPPDTELYLKAMGYDLEKFRDVHNNAGTDGTAVLLATVPARLVSLSQCVEQQSQHSFPTASIYSQKPFFDERFLLPSPDSWSASLVPQGLLLSISSGDVISVVDNTEKNTVEKVKKSVLLRLTEGSVVVATQYLVSELEVFLIRPFEKKREDLDHLRRLNQTFVDRTGAVRLWNLCFHLIYEASTDQRSVLAVRRRLARQHSANRRRWQHEQQLAEAGLLAPQQPWSRQQLLLLPLRGHLQDAIYDRWHDEGYTPEFIWDWSNIRLRPKSTP